MKVLFYHAGADCLGQPFKDHGHDVVDVMLNDEFEGIPFYSLEDGWDIEGMKKEYGNVDIILANPNCKTYSLMGYRFHRKQINGVHTPISQLAEDCDQWNADFMWMITQLNPKYYFIENPRAMLSKMDFMRDIPHYTVTYASYGLDVFKPTHIFTNHPCPNFKPPMSTKERQMLEEHGVVFYDIDGDPRTAKERSLMPEALTKHIYNIATMSDEEVESLVKASQFRKAQTEKPKKEKKKPAKKEKKPYNTTQLTPQQEFERHIYHRDQFAHYLRWSHILKVAKIGQTILDFGCSTGEMLELFYRNKYRPKQYLGLDIRKQTVDENNEKFAKLDFAEFRQCDLCQDELDLGQTFDIITCFEVMEHIGHENADAFLDNIAYHCDENTRVYLSTPNYDPKVGAAKNHMLGPEENKEVGEWDHFELQDKLSEYFDIEAKYGTFASIKDYKEEIEGDWRHVMFDELRKYYDTNMLSVIMAPVIKPEHARNCLWVLKAKQED